MEEGMQVDPRDSEEDEDEDFQPEESSQDERPPPLESNSPSSSSDDEEEARPKKKHKKDKKEKKHKKHKKDKKEKKEKKKKKKKKKKEEEENQLAESVGPRERAFLDRVRRRLEEDGDDGERVVESDDDYRDEDAGPEETDDAPINGENEAEEAVAEKDIYSAPVYAEDNEREELIAEQRGERQAELVEKRLAGKHPDAEEEEVDPSIGGTTERFEIKGFPLKVLRNDKARGVLLLFESTKTEEYGDSCGSEDDEEEDDEDEDGKNKDEYDMDDSFLAKEGEEEDEEEDEGPPPELGKRKRVPVKTPPPAATEIKKGAGASKGKSVKKSKGSIELTSGLDPGDDARRAPLQGPTSMAVQEGPNRYLLVGRLASEITSPLFNWTLVIQRAYRDKAFQDEKGHHDASCKYFTVLAVKEVVFFKKRSMKVTPDVIGDALKRSEYIPKRRRRLREKAKLKNIFRKYGGGDFSWLRTIWHPFQWVCKNLDKRKNFFDSLTLLGADITHWLEDRRQLDPLMNGRKLKEFTDEQRANMILLSPQEKLSLFREIVYLYPVTAEQRKVFSVPETDEETMRLFVASSQYHKLVEIREKYGQTGWKMPKDAASTKVAVEELKKMDRLVHVVEAGEEDDFSMVYLREDYETLRRITEILVERFHEKKDLLLMRCYVDDSVEYDSTLSDLLKECDSSKTAVVTVGSRVNRLRDHVLLFNDVYSYEAASRFLPSHCQTLIIERAHTLGLKEWLNLLGSRTLTEVKALRLIGEPDCFPLGTGNLLADLFNCFHYDTLKPPPKGDLFFGMPSHKFYTFFDEIDKCVEQYASSPTAWTFVASSAASKRLVLSLLRQKKCSRGRVEHVRDLSHSDYLGFNMVIQAQGMNREQLYKCYQAAPSADCSVSFVGRKEDLKMAFGRNPIPRYSAFNDLWFEFDIKKQVDKVLLNPPPPPPPPSSLPPPPPSSEGETRDPQ